MNADHFDEDGYPTDEVLERIEKWDWRDYRGCLDFVRGLWNWPTYVREVDRTYIFATGGWSGNESLIQALQKNRALWMRVWESSHAGGKYVFRLTA